MKLAARSAENFETLQFVVSSLQPESQILKILNFVVYKIFVVEAISDALVFAVCRQQAEDLVLCFGFDDQTKPTPAHRGASHSEYMWSICSLHVLESSREAR